MVSLEYDPTCDFCSIARGETPDTEVVWEEDAWIAFFPLNPATPGHTLIIPRTHIADLWEVQPPLDTQLMRASIQLGRAIRAALDPDGLNLITSAGKTAEQTVFHLHLHLVPRWEDDGFGKIWPAEGHYTKENLEVTADRIQDAYKEQQA
jgi:histidine triad (HIT) family protein